MPPPVTPTPLPNSDASPVVRSVVTALTKEPVLSGAVNLAPTEASPLASVVTWSEPSGAPWPLPNEPRPALQWYWIVNWRLGELCNFPCMMVSVPELIAEVSSGEFKEPPLALSRSRKSLVSGPFRDVDGEA